MHLKTTELPIHVNTASAFSVKQKPLAAVTEGDLIARPEPMCRRVHPAAAALPLPPTDATIPWDHGHCTTFQPHF